MNFIWKIKDWIRRYNIRSTTWHQYHNPYYYWWKGRKYFKRPKAHLVKGEFYGYFGMPCRTDYYKGLQFFCIGLGWKDKYNSPRHEWDPIICLTFTTPWKVWVNNEFSNETNSEGKKGFYTKKTYWFGWVFNWIKPHSNWADDSHIISMATWEALLDYVVYEHDINWCYNNHIWQTNKYNITIKDNLKYDQFNRTDPASAQRT